MDEAATRAGDDVAMRRAALDRALAALDRGDPDADPIAVVDCALALQAAEAVAGGPGVGVGAGPDAGVPGPDAGAAGGARQPMSGIRT
jgi:hypothetical protein